MADVLRLYRFRYSTNVERVALALAHKGLAYESVWVDPGDRSEVVRVSGQELVPVLEADGEVIADSTRIIRWLERRHPEQPLYPREPARRAEVELFEDWFNLVWKRPPNAIAAELAEPEPDTDAIAAWGADLRGWLDRFEALLAGRDYLMGREFSAADACAFPFLKYALLGRADDDEDPFHAVLVEHQPLGDAHPRLAGWIRRVDERPR